jgi:four helix bundle protein
MFDFEKLTVYSKAKAFNTRVNDYLTSSRLDYTTANQLRRASFSIMLNIAEGSGRRTNRDKRHFYVMSRGSTFECVAIFDYLKDTAQISDDHFKSYYLE